MHTQHWGLNDSPFSPNCLDFFHESPTHQESLARLHYLVENGRRLALLLGEMGSGKSLLLRLFANQLRQQSRQVVEINLLGVDEDQFLLTLAERLGARVTAGEPRFAVWRKITDRLAANRYQQLDTVLLLDEAGEAAAGVLQQLLRLIQFGVESACGLSIVLATSGKSVGRLGPRLLDLAELRVELETWSPEETASFLQQSMARAGSERPLFDEAATARLHQLSHGVPRRISQLAELSLLAGAGQQLSHVDDQTVDSVYRELSVTGG